jgi:DNA-binding MarR family transcriptional regulator
MTQTARRTEISRFRTQFMNLFRRLRQEAQSDDRSWTRLALLGSIERAEDGATPSLLKDLESMRSSNLAAALRELEASGLICRTPDKEDRRKVRVRLTKAGITTLHENIDRREAWLADAIEKSLTAEERALLFKAGKLFDRIVAYSNGH